MPILGNDDKPYGGEETRCRGLQAERENSERQRAELDESRANLEAQVALQRHQQQQPIIPVVAPAVANQGHQNRNIEEITTIVSNIQNYRVEVKMPKFNNE